MRTPLNSVIGFAEMLEDAIVGPLNDEQLDFVQTIDRNGRHLLQMINGILDIAKIEAGMLVLHLETADICPIIREIGDVFRPLAQKKNLILELPADGLSVPLSIDPQRCRQVMLNLLSNAIKFTPAGGRIVVAVIETAETVSIAVTDSGIGIAAADHERVFQEFVQIDGSYARKQEGTGLGLPLARRLVMLQGGELWLESAIGQGSTFGVTLPKGPQPGVTTASARHSGALG
ncbi:MAG: HAMP domain-containing histidine kinase [Candidatus Sericytochromatia bacterium]|nr:HAMP domain-containing histidine kinase [Candidatus Sericytochromatia bacterium]